MGEAKHRQHINDILEKCGGVWLQPCYGPLCRLLGGRRQFGFGDIRQKYEMSGNELFHCKEIKK